MFLFFCVVSGASEGETGLSAGVCCSRQSEFRFVFLCALVHAEVLNLADLDGCMPTNPSKKIAAVELLRTTWGKPGEHKMALQRDNFEGYALECINETRVVNRLQLDEIRALKPTEDFF